MYDFGTIVLVPFPFTDLSATKVRPALIVSKPAKESGDVIVCFITSKEPPSVRHAAPLAATPATGLKMPSAIRFDKIATLDKRIVLGELGRVEPKALRALKSRFFAVFGF